MYDIALDSQGDIAIVNGDLVLTNSISQAVLIAMRWAKGEWKYNTELGVDYFGSILTKSPDLNAITRIIREEILAVIIEYMKQNIRSCPEFAPRLAKRKKKRDALRAQREESAIRFIEEKTGVTGILGYSIDFEKGKVKYRYEEEKP